MQSGSNAIYLELKLHPYDYAAASVIVEEAGGIVEQIDGTPITIYEMCGILAGSPEAVRQVQEICHKHLLNPKYESGDV